MLMSIPMAPPAATRAAIGSLTSNRIGCGPLGSEALVTWSPITG
jgi:hypothetical protein